MFIIYEYIINQVFFDEKGEVLRFDTREEAEGYAKKNCAWDYKILEI